MPLTLYNSLVREKQVFEPIDPSRVTMYVCGPTVYNLVHIGNGRPAVVFDVLYRVLRGTYPQVVFARNITDIDDKINAAAADNGESIADLADRFTTAYNEDIEALGVLPPSVEPRATGHVNEIIATIETLIAGGHAYAAEGHVLFNVPSDPNYGQLSNRSLEDMIDGARVEVAPYKQDPKDFVLWKPSTPELPGWDSPWGRGRPGWHIECSAMINTHLGTTIDIHGGGSDLTFPHHENELAQSTCANGAAFVKYWVHNGMLTFGGEKMSKSLGNIETLRGLLETNDGEVLRYALLMGQYRSALAWGPAQLEQAKSALDRLYQALRIAGYGDERATSFANEPIDTLPDAVRAALEDDLNTPGALAALHAMAGEIHKTEDAAARAKLRRQMLVSGWYLGLFEQDPVAYFQVGAELPAERIEALIDERNAARAAKDYARADEIRAELLAADIELEDSREGTVWRRRD
ncbi:MAG: cysteine--tRNA ligase [Pseudomonadota bacterium]